MGEISDTGLIKMRNQEEINDSLRLSELKTDWLMVVIKRMLSGYKLATCTPLTEEGHHHDNEKMNRLLETAEAIQLASCENRVLRAVKDL